MIEKENYKRNTPSFEEIFGKTPTETIQSMDQAGDDIPNQRPEIQIPIPSAGMTRKNIPIFIDDPFSPGQKKAIHLTVKSLVNIPSSQRGIHVSRFGDVIAKTAERSYSNIQDCSQDIAEKINKSQYGEGCAVEVKTRLSFIENVPGRTPEKSKKSLETIGLSAKTELSTEGPIIQSAGIKFAHITACPCVQKTFQHATQSEDMENSINEKRLFITHSQRCETQVSIENIPDALNILELLKIIDNTVFRVQNTLPREQELMLVYHAHKEPQFMEDVIRSLIANIFYHLEEKESYKQSGITIRTTSMESIHDFDIESQVTETMFQLHTILKKK